MKRLISDIISTQPEKKLSNTIESQNALAEQYINSIENADCETMRYLNGASNAVLCLHNIGYTEEQILNLLIASSFPLHQRKDAINKEIDLASTEYLINEKNEQALNFIEEMKFVENELLKAQSTEQNEYLQLLLDELVSNYYYSIQ